VQPAVQEARPFPVSDIPRRIPRPSYASSGRVNRSLIPTSAVIWAPEEIIKIRESCQLARKVLEELKSLVGPGVTTESLDDHARELIIIHNAYPSPRNFHGYPKSISTSVNNVAAHGIPDSRPLVSGDILNIDVTVFLNGFHGDCSDTVAVGEADEHALKLVRVTEECVERAVAVCRPGEFIRRIGQVIHKHARSQRCTTVPLFLGHGIGDFFHGPPDIYHCLNNYPGKLRPGMVFTIEPVVSPSFNS
jgi:methionyl aminopeptidase